MDSPKLRKPIRSRNFDELSTGKKQKKLKRREDKAVKVHSIMHRNPEKMKRMRNLVPMTSKNGYTITRESIVGYYLEKEKNKKTIVLEYFKKAFYEGISPLSRIEKIEFKHDYTIIGIKEVNGEESIMFFYKNEHVRTIPTADAGSFFLYDPFCINSIAVVHQVLSDDGQNLKDIDFLWIYQIRGKTIFAKLKTIKGIDEDSKILKFDQISMFVISQKNIRTFVRGINRRGTFDANEVGCSMIFGLYSHQKIKNSVVTQDLQYLILEVKEEEQDSYRCFHSVHRLQDLYMIEDVDSTMSKSWRQSGNYLHTGVWSSPRGNGYILFFLTKKDNGVYLSFAYILYNGHFHGVNQTAKIVKKDKGDTFNFEFVSFRKSINDEDIFYLEYYLDSRAKVTVVEINFQTLFQKAINEELNKSLFDSLTDGMSKSYFTIQDMLNSQEIKEIEYTRGQRERLSGKDLSPKLSAALEMFKVRFNTQFTKMNYDDRIYFETGSAKFIKKKYGDKPIESISVSDQKERCTVLASSNRIDLRLRPMMSKGATKSHNSEGNGEEDAVSNVEVHGKGEFKPMEIYPAVADGYFERFQHSNSISSKAKLKLRHKNKNKVGKFCSGNPCSLI